MDDNRQTTRDPRNPQQSFFDGTIRLLRAMEAVPRDLLPERSLLEARRAIELVIDGVRFHSFGPAFYGGPAGKGCAEAQRFALCVESVLTFTEGSALHPSGKT